ncbi:unnamed protein product [Linum trigynum]|uniref:Uncharacterized protein n=1 Tax=Linum trigynum TaxID=586398 RepID=A0AAV2G5V7_9ROSI
MSGVIPILKKPKVEQAEEGSRGGGGGEVGDEETTVEEQESALVALIEHRTHEVEHLRKRIYYYTSQLGEAEQKLEKTKTQLARLRRDARPHKISLENDGKNVKPENSSTSSLLVNGSSSRNQTQSRTELVIPAANPKVSQPLKSGGSGMRDSIRSSAQTSSSTQSDIVRKVNAEKPGRIHSDSDVVENQDKGRKRKLEQRDHKELIPMVCRSSSPHSIYCHANNHISSQHKRKLRSLALCPVNDQLFVTSALDGLVNLWQLQGNGSSASLLSSTECISPKTRRWAEDIAWHPLGDSLVATYTADKGDSQIAIIHLNKTHGKSRVTFLQDKPHIKGIVNGITFMPWGDPCFVTGGSDHAVVVWNGDAENSWKPKKLHRDLHSSAVMGIAGMQQKQIVLSAGADKRIIGFDIQAGRVEFRNQVDSKCMSVLPNPCDFNLYMVQTGTPEKQLRLFDVRLRQTEIHTFGFKQESSDSQSALINQGWSSDGWYLSSGSVDPVIHIFDIRYNGHRPSQSIRAHQKRVFKAEFHYSRPLMISISSDLQIGLHKI